MRHTRKVTLLVMTATAAMALAAPPALAQHGPETEPLALPANTDLSVAAEPSGTACGPVSPATPPATGVFTTSGGCLIHAGGTNVIYSGHLFGIELIDSTCNWEFDFRFSGSGTGYMVHQELTQGTQGTCTRRPCDYPLVAGQEEPAATQGESRPWRAYVRENPPGSTPGSEAINFLFCLENRHAASRTSARHCNLVIPFSETPANHRYTFNGADREGSTSSNGTRCEFTGLFTTEATQLSGGEGARTQVEINHL
ncbi:MAG TPA: hypothetical protein VEX36_07925 [Thermoleophilaceae bacterium]|nr:hypothetical protein [Thermoleophilaceae bacterium]